MTRLIRRKEKKKTAKQKSFEIATGSKVRLIDPSKIECQLAKIAQQQRVKTYGISSVWVVTGRHKPQNRGLVVHIKSGGNSLKIPLSCVEAV